jgi:hypothetical protein
MFTPLTLTALPPLNPALFMRELVSRFIGVFLTARDDPETRACATSSSFFLILRPTFFGRPRFWPKPATTILHARTWTSTIPGEPPWLGPQLRKPTQPNPTRRRRLRDPTPEKELNTPEASA